MAEVKGAPIKNKDMINSLTEFVTTSGRATTKATPIYPLSNCDNHEQVFNSIEAMKIFKKLKEAKKAKGTPRVVHHFKCVAIESTIIKKASSKLTSATTAAALKT